MTYTPQFITGFETGSSAGFTLVTGAASVDATTPLNGSYRGLCTIPASTACNFERDVTGAPSKFCVRFAFSLIALPASGFINICTAQTAAASNINMRVDQNGLMQIGPAVTGPTLSVDGQRHLCELQIDVSANPFLTYAKIDGQIFGPFSSAVAAATIAKMFIGQRDTTQAQAATVAYDDISFGVCTVTGGASGDWIGDGKVLAQLADSDGTHSTVADFAFGDAGAALSGTVTTASTMVDDAPASGGWTTTRSTTDNLAMLIANTSAYLEIAPATTAESGQANAVSALMSYSSPTASVNAAACDVRNSAGAVTALNGTTGGTLAGFNVTANNFKSGLVTKPVAGWTSSEVNAVRWRFGGGTSSDISPVPTVQALMLEVDWPITTPVALAPTASPSAAATAPITATTAFTPAAASAARAQADLTEQFLSASDIEYRYSGGGSNSSPDASIGGAISSALITSGTPNNVWDDLSNVQAAAGESEYHCIYVKNTHATRTWGNVIVWMDRLSAQGVDAIALDSAAVGASAASSAANPSSAPTPALNWRTSAIDKASGLSIGDIPAGSHKAIWLRRVISPGASSGADSISIRVEGDPNGGLNAPVQASVTFNRTMFTAAAEGADPVLNVIARDSVLVIQGDADGVAFARSVKAANPTTACLLYTNLHLTMSSADCASLGVSLPDQNAYPITGDASPHWAGQVPIQAGWQLRNVAGRTLYNRYFVPLFYLDMGAGAVRDACVSGILARLELDNAITPTWDGVMLDDVGLAMSGNPLSDFWNGVDQAAYNSPIGNGYITSGSPPSPPQTTFLINGAANDFPYLPTVLGDDASADLPTLCGKFQDWTSSWVREIATRVRAGGLTASKAATYLVAGNVGRWYRPLGVTSSLGPFPGQPRPQPYRDVCRWLEYANTEGLSDNGPGYDASASAGTPGPGGTWQYNSNYAWMRDIAEASAFSPSGAGIHMGVGHHTLDAASQLYGACMLLVAVFDPRYASWGNYTDAVGASDAYWDANMDALRALGNPVGGGGSAGLGAYTASDFDAAINVPAGVIFWRSFQNAVVACNPFGVSITQAVNGVSVTLAAHSAAIYSPPTPIDPPVLS